MATVLFLAGACRVWGISPEDACQADKNKIAGKYAFCRQIAEAKAVKKGAVPDYAKCDGKLLDKWAGAEEKAVNRGAVCIDSVTDTAIQSFVASHADSVAAALDGGALPTCGDSSVNAVGEQCDGVDLAGADCTALGFSGGTLMCSGGCAFDTTACDAGGGLPASGQTTAFGAGSDGDVQAGQTLSFTDNGDGTITDNNTGLMWEKKDDAGGIHDKDDAYTWSTGTNAMDGTMVSAFLNALNDVPGGVSCFANHCDWRVPNVKELQSIVDYQRAGPAASPAFHQATCPGCADVTLASCSCAAGSYWSSTTPAGGPALAWVVNFGITVSGGYVADATKTSALKVRAVRGGL